MAKHSSHILDMARKGAEHRYDELKAEIAALVKNFPNVAGRAGENIAKAVSWGRAAVEDEAPKIRRRQQNVRRRPQSRQRADEEVLGRSPQSHRQEVRWWFQTALWNELWHHKKIPTRTNSTQLLLTKALASTCIDLSALRWNR
jgi:hypothetical protein